MKSKSLKSKIIKLLAGQEGSMMSMMLGQTKYKKVKRKKQNTMGDLPLPVTPKDILFFDEDIK